MAGTRVDRSKKPYSRPAPRRLRSDGEWLHDKGIDAPTPRGNGPASVQAAAANSKLMVSNLHYEVTPKDLTQIFGQMGTLVREPLIRYDRSGRSSGVAIIFYETSAEAKRALTQYNGKLCKGQPMSIEFDAGPPTRPQSRRHASAPSLINRIQKPPLLDRLSQKASTSKDAGRPSAPASGPGPIRTRARPTKLAKVPKKPKTAQELDMELDSFMKPDVPVVPTPAQSQPEGDVEMAS